MLQELIQGQSAGNGAQHAGVQGHTGAQNAGVQHAGVQRHTGAQHAGAQLQGNWAEKGRAGRRVSGSPPTPRCILTPNVDPRPDLGTKKPESHLLCGRTGERIMKGSCRGASHQAQPPSRAPGVSSESRPVWEMLCVRTRRTENGQGCLLYKRHLQTATCRCPLELTRGIWS